MNESINELASEYMDHMKAGEKTRFKVELTAGLCSLPAFYGINLPIKTKVLGVLAGIAWSTFFEYAYHRWVLHNPKSRLFQKHADHHTHVGQVDEPEHTTFGGGVLPTIALFTLNTIPILWLKAWPAVLVGYVCYFLLLEAVHWRIHLGTGWVPKWAQRQHDLHHDQADQRYAVFLPFWDWIFGTLRRNK